MEKKIEQLFVDLKSYVPILKSSTKLLKELEAFAEATKESKTTHKTEKESYKQQKFSYANTEYVLSDSSWMQLDLKIKDFLRENTNLFFKSANIDVNFTQNLTKTVEQQAKNIADNETIKNNFKLFLELGDLKNNLNFYSTTLSQTLINTFKDACLKNTENELICVKKTVLVLELGRTFINICLNKISPNLLRSITKILSLEDSFEKIINKNNVITAKFKKLIKRKINKQKNAVALTKFLTLIIAFFTENSLRTIKDSKQKYKYKYGAFGRILFKEKVENAELNSKRHNKALNDKIITMIDKVSPIIDKWAAVFGTVLMQHLINTKLLRNKKVNYDKFKYVYIEDVSLLFFVSRYACRFSPIKNKDHSIKASNNILIAATKRSPDIKTNDKTMVVHHNLTKNKNKLENIGYTVNNSFLEEFLQSLLGIFRSNPEDILNNKDNMLIFLSELFGINYHEQVNNNPEHKEEYLKIITALINFNKLSYSATQMPEHKKFSKRLKNISLNKKFVLNELLFHLHVTSHFSLFYFDYYYDFRGRIYPLESSINTYIPFVRNFISFAYFKPKIRKDTHEKNKELLLQSIKTLVVDNNQEIMFHKTIKSTLLDKNIKFGEKFYYYNLNVDYLNYDYIDFSQSFYSLDSRSSGFQMLTLLTKSKKLAPAANLLGNGDFDIYETAIKHILSWFKELNVLYSYFNLSEIRFYIRGYKKYLKSLEEIYEMEAKSFKRMDKTEMLNLKLTFLSQQLSNATKKGLTRLFAVFSDKQLITLFCPKSFVQHVAQKKYEVSYENNIILLFTIYNLLTLKTALNDPVIYNSLTRKAVKRLVMTKFYGSTIIGGSNQILEQFLDFCLTSNIVLKDTTYKKMRFLSKIIAKLFNPWVNNNYNKAMQFFNLTREMTSPRNRKNYKKLEISSPFFSFNYEPQRKFIKTLYVQKRKSKIIVNLPGVDFKQIQQAFVANFIQFCDANICHFFSKNFHNGPHFTIHDRFFCSIYAANRLKKEIAKAYVQVFKLNLIESNFKATILEQLLESSENQFTSEELEEALKTMIFVKP